MHTRRRFLQWSALAASALAVQAAWGKQAKGSAPVVAGLDAAWAEIEQRAGGRLGVALRDAEGRYLAGRREDERFPMCSTFKFLLAGAILHEVDAGRLRLDRRVPIAATDLLGNSPITERHVGPKGLSVGELCQATIIRSDNAAANLLFPLVGGPEGLTAFLRASGDAVTRIDRNEPTMNLFAPGDDRDTTSPAAMAGNLRRLLLGDVLKPASRGQLTAWLRDNRTGDKRLRAGLPAGWQVGDKTGFNGEDTTNDIAILWPPGGGAPLLLATYLQGAQVDPDGQNAALASVARAVSRPA
ncbi:class A beta-lactamase [Stenotrophomonas panacihumi]|uniref:Beta-lactamase n=1 Tax=Stenotrophomonas panacihumi TaxID=676599 RepID=A0A0R0A474_9GAMM|nr:class A beta-lactamase [Stenotrophomonas panacihumi]KRG37314.1 class A beta-lactamase [Stenotrophomonas panacihumi]PTN53083.1 class A beta-lactamase [Stenotrophomonas panacihumi]